MLVGFLAPALQQTGSCGQACTPALSSTTESMRSGTQGKWALGAGILERRSLLAVQQLVIKGLFRPETELVVIEVLVLLF